ncbi:hypothetical protein GLOIN_2v1770668 [Rhizophagus clarus]|nr:hypothetical protein GLOIN_2v1770668 [Rhizophagus clarus]
MQDICSSNHNPVITYFDSSLLNASVKLARAKQLNRRSHHVFIFDSVSPALWNTFLTHTDALCTIPPFTFSSWHINRMCEYLHSIILKSATHTLPARTVRNDYTPKLPKGLEILIQHCRFVSHVIHSIQLLCRYPSTFSSSHDTKWSSHLTCLGCISKLYSASLVSSSALPLTLSSCHIDNFTAFLASLTNMSKSLRGLHLLKEKEFQDFSIKTHIENQNVNFNTDISDFINSALSRSRHRIILDRVFINHPITPRLLTDPKAVADAVVDHFQNSVPIKASPPSDISVLPERWCSVYTPKDGIAPDTYDSLLLSPSLEE